MKKFIALALVTLGVTVSARAQWIVFDPTMNVQSILNTAQEIAKYVEMINNQVQQIQTLTDQLNEFKHYEDLFGDPKAVLLTTVQPLVSDLRKTEVGETLTALESAVDAGDAMFMLTALLVMLPQWGNEAQRILQTSILDGLGVDPSQVHEQYTQLLAVRRDTGNDRSWWDILGDLNAFTVELLITGILWLVGQFASLLLFWAYIIQKFILFSAYALSPLLIGFMAIRPLRSIGSRYLMHIVGVLLWPLGWAVAALITQGILDFMTDPSFRFIDPTASLYSLQATFGAAVAAFWIVFSTIAAPLVIQKVIASGELAGGQLIAGAFSSLLQTAATTAGAAAVAAPIGSPAVTAGATGMAAILSTLSTAAGHGSAGAIIIAGSGLPPRSARGRPGDDITGDKAVRDPIARTKGHYY